MTRILLLISVLFLSYCSHQAVTIRDVQSVSPMPEQIIDAHVHLEEHDVNSPMIAELRTAGIVGVVTHSSAKAVPTSPVPFTDQLRVVRCIGIGEKTRVIDVSRALQRGLGQCLKIYLGYIPKYASDPYYTPFYKLAEKLDVPVVFHTGDTYDKFAKIKYADPLTVDEVAVTYPKVRFLLAHIGNPWIASAAEVVYKNDNVYADTSALMLGDVSQVPAEVVDELVIKPIRWFRMFVESPKKLLFGSDWPLLKVAPYIETVKKAIPPEQWRNVFYQNAIDFFRMDANRVAVGE